MKLQDKAVRIRATLHLKSGTRVGGSSSGIEIGGVDLTAVKHPATGEPYVPGSSLKGRLRAMLEKELGRTGRDGTEPCGCGTLDCKVCTVFGAHKNTRALCAPTRIIVRDAPLTPGAREAFRARARDGKPTFEEKTENVINRKSGVAEHPRQQERVLWGEPGEAWAAEFAIEIILQLFEGDNKDDLTTFVRHGLGLVQEIGAIGAGGSRGSGQVEFRDVAVEEIELKGITV